MSTANNRKPDALDGLRLLIEHRVNTLMEQNPALIEQDPALMCGVVVNTIKNGLKLDNTLDTEANGYVEGFIEGSAKAAHFAYHFRRRLKQLPADLARAYDWSA